jgi:hypothetical protein
MSQNESFTCPDCYSEVIGAPGITITCTACTCEFNSAASSPFEEDELTLAPLSEIPMAASTTPTSVAGQSNPALHLEEEVLRPDQSCKQCNKLFDVDALECPNCGFNATLGRKFDPAELDPYHNVFGFDRYLMRHTQDNNTGGLMLWLHVFLAFSGITTMLIWSGWTYIFVPTMAIVYTAYRVRANHTNAFQRGKGIIPKLLLLYNRLTTWKGFITDGMRDDSVLSMRSSQFNDNSIASMEDIEAIEVLDIAGSSITDNGVRYLSTFQNLKAVVVVNCNVGEDALDELQLAIPGVCIWRP